MKELFVLTMVFGALVISGPVASPFAAQPFAEIRRHLPDAQHRGEADVTYLFFDLYTATLWTEGAAALDWQAPFALTLSYKREFSRESLVTSTLDEMTRMTNRMRLDFLPLEKWLNQCFADVTAGDRFTGVSKGPDHAAFFLNGKKTCDITYPGFAELSFGIWLSADTRDPDVTRKLLNRRADL